MSIFLPPTDLFLVHICVDGLRIGRHKSVEDYVAEYPDMTVSNAFGRKLAMQIIGLDKLKRAGIPYPCNVSSS